MLTEIPMGVGAERRGTWHRWLAETPEPEARPFWTATIWCPECARPLNLYNHKIATDGQVSPSVGHPASYPPCGWHTNPRLLGWQQWPTPGPRAIETCEQCGKQARHIGGWGTWSGGPGLICGECFKERAELTKPSDQGAKP